MGPPTQTGPRLGRQDLARGTARAPAVALLALTTDSAGGPMATEPGWYPDPNDGNLDRYWDGTA